MFDDPPRLPPDLARPVGPAEVERVAAQAAAARAADPARPSAAEALRRLALALEEDGAGWAELAPVFRRAVALDPDDYRVRLSHAIAALRCVESDGRDEAILAEGRLAAGAAAERAGDAAERGHAAYARGLLEYHGGTDPALCLPWFEEAARAVPSHPMYRMHVAQCHHERRDWPRAVAAWRAVDGAALAEGWGPWRETWRRGRLVCALAEMGALSVARDGAITLVSEIESWSPAERAERVCDLWDLEGLTRRYLPELHGRVAALAHRLHTEPFRPHS